MIYTLTIRLAYWSRDSITGSPRWTEIFPGKVDVNYLRSEIGTRQLLDLVARRLLVAEEPDRIHFVPNPEPGT